MFLVGKIFIYFIGDIMIWILFLILAFLTVYLSIRLSYYADLMSKTTNINKALIGGILLAGITSLPELVTCYSAISLDNVYLAVGDILGSNLFNLSIICVLDLFLIKKMFFDKTSNKYLLIYLILIINYIFIFLSFTGNLNISLFNIGLPSFIIIITYFVYLFNVSKKEEDVIIHHIENPGNKKGLIIKFIICAIIMIAVSVLLTFVVNIISSLNPKISTSLIGATLLGVTTSLPEVITFIALIKLNSYDLAISDIIGSNLFNLLVFAIGDIILRDSQIYNYSDIKNILLLKLCLTTTVISLYQNMRRKSLNKLSYIIPSIIIIILYIGFLVF